MSAAGRSALFLVFFLFGISFDGFFELTEAFPERTGDLRDLRSPEKEQYDEKNDEEFAKSGHEITIMRPAGQVKPPKEGLR